MPLDEPSWWYQPERTWQAQLLAPLASAYGWLAADGMAQDHDHRSCHPVICVGNFTAGGTGKTPVTRHLGELLSGMGYKPVALTRGYGGRIRGPHMIDPTRDLATDTGDEPLLLATTMPVCVSRNRTVGALVLEERPAGTVILMDDGLQNPKLFKDLTLAIVDGRRGIGNGRVIPAGPLRAPLPLQLTRADAILINRGADDGDEDPSGKIAAQFRSMFSGPILNVSVAPAGDASWLSGAKVIAYAGIANPSRFFKLLETLRADVCASVAFRDHQTISGNDARDLIARAKAEHATLVTTEKDFVRLPATAGATADQNAQHQLRSRSRTLPIKIVMPDEAAAELRRLLEKAIASAAQD